MEVFQMEIATIHLANAFAEIRSTEKPANLFAAQGEPGRARGAVVTESAMEKVHARVSQDGSMD